MLDAMRAALERQITDLLDEAERSMRAEEILPHLAPILPSANDIADVLQDLAARREVERDGSFFGRATPLPLDALFGTRAMREAAARIVDVIREQDRATGEGARVPAIVREAANEGIPADKALDAIAVLRNAGEVYSVGGDRVRLAKP